MSSKNEMDWQGETGGIVQDRMKHLLETGLNADVEFLVGTGKELANGKEEKQVIKAHKLLLVTGSSVFAAQFRFDGSTSGQGDKPIEVKDISASAFTAMLNFLYTNDISKINRENYVHVYYAAKKYFLNALVQKCVIMVGSMIDKKNVFDMLRMAKLHEETVIIAHCWTFIDNIERFRDEEFYALSQEEMGDILCRDSLRTQDEWNLFCYLNMWAAKQLENEGILEPTGEQKRAKMGHLLFAIRFPLIEHYNFVNKIVPADILNKEEITALLLHYYEYTTAENEANHPMPFSSRPRAILPREHNKLVDKFVAEQEKSMLESVFEKKNLKIEEKDEEIEMKNLEIEDKNEEIEEKNEEIWQKNEKIEEKNMEIRQKNLEIKKKNLKIEKKNKEIDRLRREIEQLRKVQKGGVKKMSYIPLHLLGRPL